MRNDLIASGEHDKQFIEDLSTQINLLNEDYENKIHGLISSNYGVEEETKVLGLFKNIGVELSNRNDILLNFLRENYGLDFLNDLDFSGALKIKEEKIDSLSDDRIKNFFSKNYVRNDGKNIHSRGYGYYFNFEGFSKHNLSDTHYIYDLDAKEYSKGLNDYYSDTFEGLSYFSGKSIDSLNNDEKEVFKILLEHYKNILLFSLNFFTLTSDKNYLADKVLNIPYNSYKSLYDSSDSEGDSAKLHSEIFKSVGLFSDLLLNIGNGGNIQNFEFNNDISKIGEFFIESERKQNLLLNKQSQSGKKTDNEGIKKNIIKCQR